MDVGISVMKKKENSTDYELINLREMVEARQAELDLFLDPGKYLILPKTTGCLLKFKGDQSKRKKLNSVKLLTEMD